MSLHGLAPKGRATWKLGSVGFDDAPLGERRGISNAAGADQADDQAWSLAGMQPLQRCQQGR
jgi:hypothetical protein